jgi:hypothetical protein
MWSTPDGERILQGAEAALFRESLGTLADIVRDDEEGFGDYGSPPFDALQSNQKLAVLAQIGTAPLRENQPAPKLCAVLEGAVGAVYENVRVMVELEIDQSSDGDESLTWREMVLAASQERGAEELLDVDADDLDGWNVLIDSLADGVLWDEDWRDSESLLDADPKAGGAVKELLGIDEDYYVALPPDPAEEEMEGILVTLRGLSRDAAGPK